MERGLVLGVLIAGVVASPRADAARPKLAVLGIEAKADGDARARQRAAALARTLTDELRARALESGFDLAPGSQKDLVELELLSDCTDEAPGCMAAIGRQLGADIVIYGHLDKQRPVNAYAVTLNRLDVGSRTVRALDTPKTVAATEDAMRRIAAATFAAPAVESAPAPEPTKLVIRTSVPAMVTVNGVARGATGEGQPLVVNDLPAGPADVLVEQPGYQRAERHVDVKAQGRTDLSVSLERFAAAPLPEPPEPAVGGERPGHTARMLFWTSLIATGVGVTAFTITGLQVRSIEKEQDQAIADWGEGFKYNGVQHPNDACAEAKGDGYTKLADICDRGQRMATVTNVLVGVSAAAAVASAIFYWRGYLGTGGVESHRLARRRAPAEQMRLAPEVYKNGAGLGAVIQF